MFLQSNVKQRLTSQLAKKWHPDSNKEKGANERFLEIQSAYDVSYQLLYIQA